MKVKETNDPYVEGQTDLIKFIQYQAKLTIQQAEEDGDLNKLLDLYNLIKNLKPISK